MATGESSGTTVSKAEFDRLLLAMEGIQQQMRSMKKLCDDRDAANERLVKRIKLDKGPIFKRKSNEKQFHFNEQVLEKVSIAADSVAATPPAVERAKEALKEGEGLITARQKVIRIADRSEFGWATVEESMRRTNLLITRTMKKGCLEQKKGPAGRSKLQQLSLRERKILSRKTGGPGFSLALA